MRWVHSVRVLRLRLLLVEVMLLLLLLVVHRGKVVVCIRIVLHVLRLLKLLLRLVLLLLQFLHGHWLITQRPCDTKG